MLSSILFFELILSIDTNAFNEQLELTQRRSRKKGYKLIQTDFGYVDETFVSEGYGIAYHNDTKKRKIRFIVHPCSVLDDDDEIWKPSEKNIARLLEELDVFINSYFCADFNLNDFKVARADFATDINVGSQEKILDYIKVLNNIGKVQFFKPIKYDINTGTVDKDRCFALRGNTNGVEFWAYGLKYNKEILRAEVRLTTKEVIRTYADDDNTANQIKTLAKNSADILMDTFQYVIPKGDYFRKSKADKLITERVHDGRMRRKMLKLVDLIPIKKSLHLAQKALNARDIRDIMKQFGKINVSPVTIAKRHEIKELKSLYSYLQ